MVTDSVSLPPVLLAVIV
jgi:hypothetical protein